MSFSKNVLTKPKSNQNQMVRKTLEHTKRSLKDKIEENFNQSDLNLRFEFKIYEKKCAHIV